MSRIYGKNWQPCLRENGKVMMRVNPEPVILALDDIVDALTYRAFDYAEYEEILSSNKTQLKEMIQSIANDFSYLQSGYELSYHDDDAAWELYHSRIKAHVIKHFPEFDQRIEAVQ